LLRAVELAVPELAAETQAAKYVNITIGRQSI
jgi:hypothetical protein